MTRLNLILFFALIFSALGLVNAQHKARKLYIELEQMGQEAKQFDQEYGQLQLEQSTWAMHSRIELVATQVLQMHVPDSKRIQVVSIGAKNATPVVIQPTATPAVIPAVTPTATLPAAATQSIAPQARNVSSAPKVEKPQGVQP